MVSRSVTPPTGPTTTANAANTPPHIPVMKGGAREQLLDMAQKYAQPLSLYFGFALVLLIVYVGQIPDWVAYQGNTFLGRLLLFSLTIFVADTYSWIYALLMALFAVLLIAVAPRTLKEGMQDVPGDMGDSDVKLVGQKHRWWVERLFKENPIGIEEEKVKTIAAQDGGSSSNSATSSK